MSTESEDDYTLGVLDLIATEHRAEILELLMEIEDLLVAEETGGSRVILWGSDDAVQQAGAIITAFALRAGHVPDLADMLGGETPEA